MIDTSAWIEFFRNRNSGISEQVDDCLASCEVCVPRIVLAELIQGAKSDREITVIQGFFRAFTIIDQSDDSWLKAGKLSYTLRRKGNTTNLTDCYIAVIAEENNCAIFTLDRHFKIIQQHAGIQLIDPESKRHGK